MNKKISIIIVTYNSENVIKECLESIEKYNDICNAVEIIIVDNSPTFKIEKYIKALDLKFDIKMIHNPENGGFGQGNNIGVDASSGDILFILNPDTILVEPIFKYIIEEFNRLKLTVAGCRLINRDGKDNDSVGLLPQYNFLYIPRFFLNFLTIDLGFFLNFVYPWGAGLLIKRDKFLEANKFDENIFLCNEEPDLIMRIKNKRIKIFNKKIIHLEGHTTNVSSSRYIEYLKSTLYYFKKYNINPIYYFSTAYIKMIIKKFIFKITNKDVSLINEQMNIIKRFKDNEL